MQDENDLVAILWSDYDATTGKWKFGYACENGEGASASVGPPVAAAESCGGPIVMTKHSLPGLVVRKG